MKNRIIIFTAAITLGLGSCSKHYFDINNNPNVATNTTPELVLPSALTVTASAQAIGGTTTNLEAWMGYLGQSGSYATGVGDIASYMQTTAFANTTWINSYRNLNDYDYIEKTAITESKWFYAAAAKIMKAYVFQQLVDEFGNVPYTEAFKGTTIITPKYDDAQTVYNAITVQVDSAVTLLQRSDVITPLASSDILFGGKVGTWVQFANSLKLRILIRQTQVAANQSFIQAELAKITANGGGFLKVDAGVNPGYANNAGQQNPTWSVFVTLTGLPTSGGGADLLKAQQYALTWLKNNGDTNRMKRIYGPNGSGQYVGSVLGAPVNPAGTGASTFGPGILNSVSQPAYLMTAAESYFLQAEAIARSWLTGDDKAAFNAGVQADFNLLGAGDATAYLAQSNKETDYTLDITLQDKLDAIIRQKWVANDMILPIETWDDYRRLHLPADIPLSISPFLDKSPAAIPIRYLYPVNEYQTNGVNANAQGTIDYHATKVFWNQ
jgi:Starch-binding associating with outer membrane